MQNVTLRLSVPENVAKLLKDRESLTLFCKPCKILKPNPCECRNITVKEILLGKWDTQSDLKTGGNEKFDYTCPKCKVKISVTTPIELNEVWNG